MSKRRNSKTRERSTGPLPPKVSKKKAVSNIHTEITPTARKYFKTPGVVLTLGEGDVGQLGLDPDISPRSRPTLLPDLESKNVVFVCAGGMHTLCLTENGTVLSFGCNDEGALGREGSEYEPLPVDLPDKVAQVAAGDSHSAALLEDGRVFAWGAFRDSHGSMGLTVAAPEQPQKVPVRIPVEGHVVKIASGADHLVMLTASGHAYTCGCGEQGQLGRVVQRSANRSSRQGLNHLLVPAPVIVKAGKKQLLVDDVWASNYCTFFKEKANGYMYASGLNNYNQLGVPKLRNTEILCEYFPKKAESLCNKSWTLITGGQHHTILLDVHGVAYALGRREYGRLGLGKECEDAVEPTPIPALKNKKCVNVACGSCVSFAVTADGDVFAWGMGTNNQLGTGNDDDVYEPTKIQGKQLDGRKTVQVAGGGQHTVLLAV